MTRILALAVGMLAGISFTFAGLARGDESTDPTFTDPAKAGADFEVQGEYVGETQSKEKWGAQVIALGDGKFEVVAYEGGLPGEGWKRGDKSVKAEGRTTGGVTKFESGDCTAELADGKIEVVKGGQKLAAMTKIERQSPTLGAMPPEGALVLFDGSSADAFENGRTTDEGLLLADCASKQNFGDHTLHIEFRTPFKPFAREQGRGNSGVYAQSRYEIQVLDSFGLEGENNECGGIYSIAKPAVNMCFPPLSWQTYDIDFTAARYDESGKKTKNGRITVRHNGVVIHDDVELPNGTAGRLPEEAGDAPLYLQGHGNPVVYRNIWVVEKKE